MAIYRLKSKIFATPSASPKPKYTAAQRKSYQAGMQAAQKKSAAQIQNLQNQLKQAQGSIQDLQNKPSGMGTGLLVGSLGAIGGTAALNTIKRNSEESAASMGQAETY